MPGPLSPEIVEEFEESSEDEDELLPVVKKLTESLLPTAVPQPAKPVSTDVKPEPSSLEESSVQPCQKSDSAAPDKTTSSPVKAELVEGKTQEEKSGDSAAAISTDKPEDKEAFCFCKGPRGDESRFSLSCDFCHKWYHGDCVGMTRARANTLGRNGEQYKCAFCKHQQEQRREAEKQEKLRQYLGVSEEPSGSSENTATNSEQSEQPSNMGKEQQLQQSSAEVENSVETDKSEGKAADGSLARKGEEPAVVSSSADVSPVDEETAEESTVQQPMKEQCLPRDDTSAVKNKALDSPVPHSTADSSVKDDSPPVADSSVSPSKWAKSEDDEPDWMKNARIAGSTTTPEIPGLDSDDDEPLAKVVAKTDASSSSDSSSSSSSSDSSSDSEDDTRKPLFLPKSAASKGPPVKKPHAKMVTIPPPKKEQPNLNQLYKDDSKLSMKLILPFTKMDQKFVEEYFAKVEAVKKRKEEEAAKKAEEKAQKEAEKKKREEEKKAKKEANNDEGESGRAEGEKKSKFKSKVKIEESDSSDDDAPAATIEDIMRDRNRCPFPPSALKQERKVSTSSSGEEGLPEVVAKTKKQKKQKKHKKKSHGDDDPSDKLRMLEEDLFHKTKKEKIKKKASKEAPDVGEGKRRRCIIDSCRKETPASSNFCRKDCLKLHVSRYWKAVGHVQPSKGDQELQNPAVSSSEDPPIQVELVDRPCGIRISGDSAPAVTGVYQFLLKHPSFELVFPEKTRDQLTTETRGQMKRGICRKMIECNARGGAFRTAPDPEPDRIQALATQIEEELYKFNNGANSRYKTSCNLLIKYLESNKSLFEMIISGQLKPHRILTLDENDYKQVGTKHFILPSSPTRSFNPLDSLLAADTTKEHGRHVYDINCKKCVKKNQLKREREKDWEKAEEERRKAHESHSEFSPNCPYCHQEKKAQDMHAAHVAAGNEVDDNCQVCMKHDIKDFFIGNQEDGASGLLNDMEDSPPRPSFVERDSAPTELLSLNESPRAKTPGLHDNGRGGGGSSSLLRPVSPLQLNDHPDLPRHRSPSPLTRTHSLSRRPSSPLRDSFDATISPPRNEPYRREEMPPLPRSPPPRLPVLPDRPRSPTVRPPMRRQPGGPLSPSMPLPPDTRRRAPRPDSPLEPVTDIVWKGFVQTTDASSFKVHGFHLGGNTSGLSADIPQYLFVKDTLSCEKAFDFMKKWVRFPTKSLAIIQLIFTDVEAEGLYREYFRVLGKNTVGRVDVDNERTMNCYVIPIGRRDPIPPGLGHLDVADPRDDDMLVCVVSRYRAPGYVAEPEDLLSPPARYLPIPDTSLDLHTDFSSAPLTAANMGLLLEDGPPPPIKRLAVQPSPQVDDIVYGSGRAPKRPASPLLPDPNLAPDKVSRMAAAPYAHQWTDRSQPVVDGPPWSNASFLGDPRSRVRDYPPPPRLEDTDYRRRQEPTSSYPPHRYHYPPPPK